MSVVVATYVWLLNSSRGVNRLFGIYWFSIAFWSFFVGTQFRTINIFSPFWWGWFLHLGCTFIPVLLFHFVTVLTNEESLPKIHFALVSSYGIVILFNLLNLWTPYFTNGTAYRDAYAYPQPALFYPLYFVFFVVIVSWSTFLLVRYLAKLPPSQQRGLKIFLVTHILAYIGGMDNFLIMADIRIPPLYPHGLYFIIPYTLVAMYVSRRYLFANASQ